MSRGNRQEYILGADGDKVLFLETLSDCCGMTGWVVHAYVKQAIAWVLRKKTAVSHDWIVEHIHMGSRYSVQNAVKAIDALEGTKHRTWRKQILQINNSLH